MSKMDKLFRIAEENDIIIEYVSFPRNIQGLYYKEPGLPPMIGINERIVSNTKLFACVLAEELGHHFTTVGDTCAEYYSYAARLDIDKKETMAMKWATETLLPAYEIVEAAREGITTFEDLADKLEVTGEFLLKRLEFIAKYSASMKIDSSRYLMINRLPNIYVLEHINIDRDAH